MSRKDFAALTVLAALIALWIALARREFVEGPTGAWMAAQGLAPRLETVEIPGRSLRVRYVRTGTGSPVVLLHGLGTSAATWRDVIPALARGHDVVALDLPGFGGSDQPQDLDFSMDLAVVPALMGRLGIRRAAFVGNSLGGALATFLAADRPELVDRIVLIDAAGFNFAPKDRPALLRFAAASGSLLDPLPVKRLLVTTALRQVFHDKTKVTPERVDLYLEPLLRPGASASVRSLLLATRAVSFRETAERVRAPTLILWGREDTWISVEHAARFAAAIPGARTVILEGCGHMPQEEEPEDVTRLLLAFLAEAQPAH